jgi:hypothetical protein
MSETFNPSQKFLEFWADVAAKVAAAGMSNGNTPPTQTARDVRGAVFDAMSQYADQFMRSPQFLDFARHSLDVSMQVREQLNDFLTKLRHEFQGVAKQDVESVLASVHQMERRVMDRLDEMDRKLSAFSGNTGRSQSRTEAPAARVGKKPPSSRR